MNVFASVLTYLHGLLLITPGYQSEAIAALIAVGLSLALGLANVINTAARAGRNLRRVPMPKNLAPEITYFFRHELLLIVLLWLAFGTPFSQLPFPAPTADATWLLLPAPTLYLILATVVHGAFAVLGGGLLNAWRVQITWLIRFKSS